MNKVRVMIRYFALTCFVALLSACRGGESSCPAPAIQVDPETIPDGESQTSVEVRVNNPTPDNGREVISELYADSGTFDDPFATETTYTCAHDVVGEVELCVAAGYGPEAGAEPSQLGAAFEYLRRPHAFFADPDDCRETSCTKVVCPADRNECPVISELSVTPDELGEGQFATVVVAADDPDENPGPLVTTLVATAGSFGDRHASETSYSCDPTVGGPIEVCVQASDGDADCDDYQCVTVQCPGPVPDNVCPSIRDLTADPVLIERFERQSLIEVDAFDPDAVNPEPLRTILSASSGTFQDRDAATTLYTCGAPGPAEICVDATDGDRECDQNRCITVQCPSTVPENACPKLYTVHAIPSTVPEGETQTEIQVEASDSDGPLPLLTTLYSLRGSFDDIHADRTLYTCERAGLNEVCADASDGACVKTLCTDVYCPEE